MSGRPGTGKTVHSAHTMNDTRIAGCPHNELAGTSTFIREDMRTI